MHQDGRTRTRVPVLVAIASAMVLFPTPGKATLISVSGPPSSVGVFAFIIPNPASITDSGEMSLGQRGFNEAQGVITLINHAIDGPSFIPEGTLVNSHMIFLNPQGNLPVLHPLVEWVFDGPILGVMSDVAGYLEASSSFDLGAPGTTYFAADGAPFIGRGIEDNDGYIINGNTLIVSMAAAKPGDWIRVVTEAAAEPDIPEPGTYGLALTGLALMGVLKRKSRASRNG